MELKEKIFKDYAEAYHRTDPDNVIPIAKTGFRPGGGAMYGKGWYFTYDLDSQLRPNMNHYGSAIIKARVDLKGVLIFDYNIAKKVLGKKYTLVDQLLDLRVYEAEPYIPGNMMAMSKALEETFKDPQMSAVYAANTFVSGTHPKQVGKDTFSHGWGGKGSMLNSKGVPHDGKITGIIFTGNHDGNVIVSYAHDTAVPTHYTISDNQGNIDPWTPIKEASDAKERAERARAVIDTFDGKVKSLKSEIDYDMIGKQFDWLFQAKFNSAIIEIKKDGTFIWKDGFWENGSWYGDIWKDGHWKKGKWHKGEFQKGIWNAGNFLDGIFGNKDTAIWLKGTWTNGVWGDYGKWESGVIKVGDDYVPSKEPPQ